jgi:hypothetical protein
VAFGKTVCNGPVVFVVGCSVQHDQTGRKGRRGVQTGAAALVAAGTVAAGFALVGVMACFAVKGGIMNPLLHDVMHAGAV